MKREVDENGVVKIRFTDADLYAQRTFEESIAFCAETEERLFHALVKAARKMEQRSAEAWREMRKKFAEEFGEDLNHEWAYNSLTGTFTKLENPNG